MQAFHHRFLAVVTTFLALTMPHPARTADTTAPTPDDPHQWLEEVAHRFDQLMFKVVHIVERNLVVCDP